MATTSNTSGYKSFTATAVAIAEAVRVKLDSSGTISAAGVNEDWIGITEAPVAASGSGTVRLRNAPGTVEVTAAGAFAVGARLYSAASGKVDDTGNGDFTGLVALQAAGADGDIVEAAPVVPAYAQVAATESLAAADTLTAADNGKTILLASATGFAVTLPAAANGLHFRFIVATAPTSGNHTIVTAASANVIHGQIASAEDAAGSVSTAASADTISFVANKAIKGDTVDLISDGTSWFVRGFCNVQDGITTTQAS